MCIFYALSQHKSKQWESTQTMDLKVVKDSFCQIPISSSIIRIYLSDAGESLLCDYPMVINYILETNLTKRQNIKNSFIQF